MEPSPYDGVRTTWLARGEPADAHEPHPPGTQVPHGEVEQGPGAPRR